MTIKYVLENNCSQLAATFKNNGMIKVQKQEDASKDGEIIYEVHPLESFIGKTTLCDMTEFSGARDKELFDANTILLNIGKENNKYKYIYIAGDQVCSFLTNDKIYKYISNMGNNLCPYSIAIGYENIYYLTPYFKYTKRENIDIEDIDKLFDDTNNSDYQKLKTYKIYSNYDEFNFKKFYIFLKENSILSIYL